MESASMTVLFSYAFRPLFLLATLHAIVAVPVWTAAWLGYLAPPTLLGNATLWHAHEMIFGFAGAAIGGFALTAVAAWTGRTPVSGTPLMVLSALWLLARGLFALPSSISLGLAILSDLGYGALLFGLMSREVMAVRSRRNYKVLVILGLLPVANATFFAGLELGASWARNALLAGLWLVLMLINLIGGRIIPAFTRNWLKRQAAARGRLPSSLPPSFDGLDRAATWSMVAFAILQVIEAPSSWTAAFGVMTGTLLVARLLRWHGIRTIGEPLVWVLHLAFAWLPIGMFLLAASELGMLPRSCGTHALTAGAITTSIMAVAGRAALGHTGRALESHPILTLAYLSITIAAISRVAATLGPGARPLLLLSAVAWCLGFLGFAWRYVPILTQPPLPRSSSLPTL